MSSKKAYDPSKLSPEEYSTTQMVCTARAFLNAAKLCNEPSYLQIGWSHPLLIPIVTNISFACEVFLKVFLNENNCYPKEHDLFNLFNFLPENTQEDIIGKDDYDDFIIKLKQNSDFFGKWRYIYEYRLISINIGFLFDLAERMSILAN